ncbi:ComEC/Rec2 family competence protein [Cohnella mopanensis]|uniref:ComEC/Rec2 family competence protein n=1 Tax=Cohnella mopanensis TaxID=2911966 RepID=UPI001EF88D6F|nr:ComEC/Rec2 family competence protein [Cohnella mopanensis]
MNSRPLVGVACCWIVGVSIGSLFQGYNAILTLSGLLMLLLGIAFYGKITIKLTFICGLALLFSFGERNWVEHRNESDIEASAAIVGSEVVLHGYITSTVEVDGDLATFRLQANAINFTGGSQDRDIDETVIVRIKLTKQEEQRIVSDWRRGERILIAGVWELPGGSGNFGAFDYREYLMKQGIYWQLAAKGANSVTFTGEPSPFWNKGLTVLDDLRLGIGKLMDRMYSTDDSGYMKGLVVGIRSDLNPEQFDQFARLGLTHVLAISGLHVGVIVYLLLQIGAWTRMTRERALSMTIAMMPMYMLITGASPSAVRACLMAMLALWLARRHALKDGLHLLLAAAMLMLLWNPLLIEDVSFQLSFLVTAGLILFVPTVTESLPIPWAWLRGAVSVTLTAQIVSFPVTIYYFHAVHLLSLPANFVLVPFISFIVMPLGMASIALGAIWLPLGIIPARMASLGNQWTFSIIDWLDSFVGMRTVWPQPSLMWVVTAYVLMGVGIVGLKRRLAHRAERNWWKQREDTAIEAGGGEQMTAPLIHPVEDTGSRLQYGIRVLIRVSVSVLAVGWLLWGFQPAWLGRGASVSFLNVGQGDSILIRTGAGKNILIDAGGTVKFRKSDEQWRSRQDPYEVGRKLIVPLLLKRGVRQIDALVLTHFDADHIGGAQAVLGNVPVRSLLINGTVKDSPGVLSLLRMATASNIPVYSVHAPMEWAIDESTKIQVVYPLTQPTSSNYAIPIEDDQNDSSIVLLVTIYGRTFLFPGDLEERGELEIVERIRSGMSKEIQAIPPIDVLKAGHHGSKTSTTPLWVNYWLSRETVISVGRNNFYGHPNSGVIERLSEAGSRIWRTDLNGEIQYRIKPGGAMERRVLQIGDIGQ